VVVYTLLELMLTQAKRDIPARIGQKSDALLELMLTQAKRVVVYTLLEPTLTSTRTISHRYTILKSEDVPVHASKQRLQNI